ncbi:MAG: hypothetical protein LAN71_00520 [Acidobacteriia bacterium]|nr:hypothetical protein [Terriglobia bacterium]
MTTAELPTIHSAPPAPAEAALCEATLRKLLAYCRENDWAGYEPYDATNSGIFTALPFLNSRIPRLILTQAMKRSPVDIRGLLLIKKTQNPKAIAIFLSAFLKLSQMGVAGEQDYAGLMIDRLIALRTSGSPYWCWGYNFPWQTRTVLVPRWDPNLVCTAFAAGALLDAYEQRGDARCLPIAVSAAEYLLQELFWSGENGVAGFCYPMAGNRSQIHNANFLASALLCRVYKHTGDKKFLAPALQAARHSASQQRADGSWAYGESPRQQWVDNFHTGYNLSSLHSIARLLGTSEFDGHIRRGLDFYREHFFLPGGAVRYYHDRTYPIDAHCVAQSILTLLEFQDVYPDSRSQALSVFRWAMQHMWDERGFFYFRVLRFFKNRISYIRWTQAWMLLALTALLAEFRPLPAGGDSSAPSLRGNS